MTFFSNFANDSQTSHRVGLENQFFTKKVLLKFYLQSSNLANLKFHGDKVGNSTCTDCISIPNRGSALSVWGYCFIRGMAMREPDDWIEQDTFLTPFLCLIVNVSTEDEKLQGTDMIKDRDLESIITSALLIASADGPLNENDKRIITSYLNKHYASGDIIWTKPKKKPTSPYDKYRFLIEETEPAGPYDILQDAISSVNLIFRHEYNRQSFFMSLSSLQTGEYMELWDKIVGNSEKRKAMQIELYRKICYPY